MPSETFEQKLEDAAHTIEKEVGIINSEIEKALSPIIAELKPIVEQDAQDLLKVGVVAAQSFLASGGNLTLTAVETAGIVGVRAIAQASQAKGIQLSQQACQAIFAASPAPINPNQQAPAPSEPVAPAPAPAPAA